MPLDRTSIEKNDFPVGRRGYNPEAVQSHLRAIAEEVEELKRSASRQSKTETLAGMASVRVQAIVDAAEQSSAEIRRQAEEEARVLRHEASSESQRERDEAIQAAREYVSEISEAVSQLRSRLETMESELGALLETLRTGGNRLTAELEVIESGMSDLKDIVGRRPPSGAHRPTEAALSEATELEPEAPLAAAEPETEPIPAGALEDDEEALPAEPKTAAEMEPEPELEPESEVDLEPGLDLEPEPKTEPEPEPLLHSGPEAEEAGTGDDPEGARLIALNMALNGTPREETDRYLAENFELADRGQLLDEVYASVES